MTWFARLPQVDSRTVSVLRGIVAGASWVAAYVLGPRPETGHLVAAIAVGFVAGFDVLERGWRALLIEHRPRMASLGAVSASLAAMTGGVLASADVAGAEALLSQALLILFVGRFVDGELPVPLGTAAFATVAAVATGLTSPDIVGATATVGATLLVTLPRREQRRLTAEEALDRALGDAKVVAFDRRSVITRTIPRTRETFPLSDVPAIEIVRLAAAAEFPARHPLRDSLLELAEIRAGTVPSIRNFTEHPGEGVTATLAGREILCGREEFLRARGLPAEDLARAERAARRFRDLGDTVIFICVEGTVLGGVAFTNSLRPGVVPALTSLRALGYRIAIVSRDAPESTAALRGELGGYDVVTPADARRADALLASGQPTVYVRRAAKEQGLEVEQPTLRLTTVSLDGDVVSDLARRAPGARRARTRRRLALVAFGALQFALWVGASAAFFTLHPAPPPEGGVVVFGLAGFLSRRGKRLASDPTTG